MSEESVISVSYCTICTCLICLYEFMKLCFTSITCSIGKNFEHAIEQIHFESQKQTLCSGMLHLFYVSLKYRNIVLAIKRPQYSIMKDHNRIDLIIHSCSYKLQVRSIQSHHKCIFNTLKVVYSKHELFILSVPFIFQKQNNLNITLIAVFCETFTCGSGYEIWRY